jgi:hypothetical protein
MMLTLSANSQYELVEQVMSKVSQRLSKPSQLSS